MPDQFTNGGYTPGCMISAGAAGGDPTVIKAGPGSLGWLLATNNATSARRVKIYDSLAPDNTQAPVQILELPAAAANSVAGAYIPIPSTGALDRGMGLATGISFRITQGQANSDNTPAGAGDVVVSWGYA